MLIDNKIQNNKLISTKTKKTEDTEIQNIFQALNLLNPQQLLSFKELVFNKENNISDDAFIKFIKERFVRKTSGCPHCHGNHIIKFGKNQIKKQYYKCKDCNKLFSASTASPLSYTKKPITQWFEYLKCMCQNLTIRESAVVVGVHRNTAFYWRHKILNAIKSQLSNNLSKIIEMDEIKICDNFKGNHSRDPHFSMGRPPRSNGRTHQEKICENKVCILCCKDRTENILTQVTGRDRSRCNYLISLLKNNIPAGSIICTNNNGAYIGLANILKLKLYKMTYYSEIIDKIYHNHNARSFGQDFLKFLSMFKGVATKYLNFYLTWFKWMDAAKSFLNSFRTVDLFLLITSSNSQLRIKDFKLVQSLT